MTSLFSSPLWKSGKSREAGISLVELMIAIALGLVVLTVLSTLFVKNSANRREIDRSASVIENGRYALAVLKDELSHAGFYSTLSSTPPAPTGGTFSPCSSSINDWRDYFVFHAYGSNQGDTTLNACFSTSPALPARKANSDALIIKRTSTCIAGTVGCENVATDRAYLQVSECGSEFQTTPFIFALGDGTFNLKKRVANTTNCDAAGTAPRRYFYNSLYYISSDDRLIRADRVPNGAFVQTTIAENVESMQISFGFDNNNDGTPDVFATTPPSGRTWADAMGARIWVLVRAPTETPGYSNIRTITMDDYTVAPTDRFKRHVFSTYVAFTNPAGRLFK